MGERGRARLRCAWAYTDAYGRPVRCDAVEASGEHDHAGCPDRDHPEWWGCHRFQRHAPVAAATAAA